MLFRHAPHFRLGLRVVEIEQRSPRFQFRFDSRIVHVQCRWNRRLIARIRFAHENALQLRRNPFVSTRLLVVLERESPFDIAKTAHDYVRVILLFDRLPRRELRVLFHDIDDRALRDYTGLFLRFSLLLRWSDLMPTDE